MATELDRIFSVIKGVGLYREIDGSKQNSDSSK